MHKTSYRKNINVSVFHSDGLVKIVTDDDVIEAYIHSPVPPNHSRLDFAAWFFLPIAMRCNADITIQGAGSQSTAKNAQRISQIWETWMPSRFNSVQVSFTQNCDEAEKKLATNSLCFYSGGVDSTYSIIKRHQRGQSQSLLTVHGMDYRYDDEKKFLELIEKTKCFSDKYGNERLFVKTNAYSVYNKYKVNTPTSHISHIFALAGSAFTFSEHFEDVTIAADYRLDQQFSVHPWGSNSATNHLFNDGATFLQTDGDDVTRSDKMPLLLASQEALSALSFCVNYNSRPNNCGNCSKCMRTKLMFLAATGSVPGIFHSSEIDSNSLRSIDLTKKSERAFFTDLYCCAKRNDRLDAMPYLNPAFERLKKIDLNAPPRISSNYLRKFMRKFLGK